MRHTAAGALSALALLLAALPLAAQPRPDYLTDEEVQKARDAQEPNKRILFFLEVAASRLAKFEKALDAKPPATADELTELMDQFVRAIDDASNTVDSWLKQGGVKLEKARQGIDAQASEFLERLQAIDKSGDKRLEEFRWTWEDARDATRELLEAAAKIPEGVVPAEPRSRVESEPKEEKREPGRPTLRKKDEPKPAPPRPLPSPPRPPQPPPDTASHGSA
mgnify:CR=1 FL=1